PKEDEDPPAEKLGESPLALSADSETLATCATDGRIQIWDVKTRKVRAELKPKLPAITACALSKDGRLVAAIDAGSEAIYVWDTVSAKRIALLYGPTELVYALAFSPDVKKLASGYKSGKILLWDLPGK